VPRLIERHFPERIPPTEKKARPTEGCVVCYKSNRRKENVKLPYVLKNVSRHSTQSYIFKVNFIAYLKSLDIPKYSVSSFIKIQPLLIKLHYFE